jgi:hypothetical protein
MSKTLHKPSLIRVPIDSNILFTSIQVCDLPRKDIPPNILSILPTDYIITLEKRSDTNCGFWCRISSKTITIWPIEPHPNLGILANIFKEYTLQFRPEIVSISILLHISTSSPSDYETYVDAGFNIPLWVKEQDLIQLTFTRIDSSTSRLITLDKIEFMINAWSLLRTVSNRLKRFELVSSDLKILYTKLYDLKEWSCCWTKIGSNRLGILHHTWRSADEDYDSNKGNVTESLSVELLTDTKYTCHTHPFIGYLVYGNLSASPSVVDFTSCLNLYHIYRFHFVATMEGIYQIEFTPETKVVSLYLDQFHPECFEILVYLFGLFLSNQRILRLQYALQDFYKQSFEHLETEINQIREMYYTGQFTHHELDPIRAQNIQKYLTYVNNGTLESLLNFKPSHLHNLTQKDLNNLEYNRTQLMKCLSTFIETDFSQLKLCYFRFLSWEDVQSHPFLEAIDYEDISYAPFMALKSG